MQDRRMLTGPSVFICSECVSRCNAILAQGGESAEMATRRIRPAIGVVPGSANLGAAEVES
jgi:hypothetical protein